jgi:hypothetical protein
MCLVICSPDIWFTLILHISCIQGIDLSQPFPVEQMNYEGNEEYSQFVFSFFF